MTTSPSIAIVGSGPSGCYTAQFLRKHWRDSEIVIFDRLASPYGLVRYGVAPDHPGTKAVTKQFDRLFERDGVRFCGATSISSTDGLGDVTVGRLREAFDIVVLATGLHTDRTLGIPGAGLTGVHRAGRLTRLINGHPDESIDGLQLGERLVIVGHGNVAIDVLRLVLTPPEQLHALGVDAKVTAAISNGRIRQVDVIGRSLPALAKFDVAMMRELQGLPDVRFEADLPDDASPRQDAVESLIIGSDPSARRLVRFHFGWEPVELVGGASVSSITVRSLDGGARTASIPADAVCTAVGFTEGDDALVQRAHHESADPVDLDRGVLGDGLFCVGWLRRGPRGTIPANRVDARMVADSIIAQHAERRTGAPKPGYRVMATAHQSTTTTN